MGIDVVVHQLALLFIIMGIGYLAYKIKFFTDETNKLLSRLVIFVTMPCTILSSVMNGSIDSSSSDAFLFIGLALGVLLVAIVLSFFIPRLIGCAPKDYGVYRFAMVLGNAGFMGFPVISAILGPKSMFYVALMNIPTSLVMYTIGIIFLSGKSAKIRLRDILNPCLVAAVVILIIFLTGFKAPRIVAETTALIGGMTTPGVMLAIGSTLATTPFRDVITKWRLYAASAVKLLLIPTAAWLILKPLVSNQLIFNILILVAAMPTAANTALLAFEFGSDEKLGSSLVFITTLLSAITIPIVTALYIVA